MDPRMVLMEHGPQNGPMDGPNGGNGPLDGGYGPMNGFPNGAGYPDWSYGPELLLPRLPTWLLYRN